MLAFDACYMSKDCSTSLNPNVISNINGSSAQVLYVCCYVIHLDWMQPDELIEWDYDVLLWMQWQSKHTSLCSQHLPVSSVTPTTNLPTTAALSEYAWAVCVVLFAPLNLPAILLRFLLRLLKSIMLALIIESKRAPIVRETNFLSRCLSGLREWDSLILKETHLITSDPRGQLHQLNLSSIISQCVK